MQKIQKNISVALGIIGFATFAVFGIPKPTEAASNTMRVCVVLQNVESTILLSTTPPPFAGNLSVNFSSSKEFTSSVGTPTVDFSLFESNMLFGGIPAYCATTIEDLPFGDYFYTKAIVTGDISNHTQSVLYYEGNDFNSVAQASAYNNALFTPDPLDDQFVNISSDGYMPLDQDRPNRTLVVFMTYTNTPVNRYCADGVTLTYVGCNNVINTPPSITVVGTNPTILTVGSTFTDEGATASDTEDGNITQNIVVTGTVDTTVPGTYTLTYTVTDAGGLTTSAIRTVIVLPVASCSANVNMISNGGFENPALTIPWGSVHIATPNFFWTSYDTVVYPFVEVQAGYTEVPTQWLPHGGVQYAEIDGGTNHDVSQVLATIPGKSYTLSYWASPRPNQSTTTNIMNISVNGQLFDTYIGAGSIMTDWSQRSYTFTATSSVTRVSFTQGQNDFKGEGVFLDDVSFICNPTPYVNTPPSITVVGTNPTILTVGSTFTDEGATASDTEDGNITQNIVVTGTVDTTVPGTYAVTYTITDSEGLSASSVRSVIVLPVASCPANTNLIKNGGFEYQVVNNQYGVAWMSTLYIPDFYWTTYSTVSYPYVELQAGYTEVPTQWLPHGGVQYAEIDGGTSHDVSQVLATIPGNSYTLSYWASPRPNQSAAVNIMNISVNGQLLDTYSAEGSNMTDWSQRSYTFTATSSVTRVSFTQGQDTTIGEGVLLDDVSVVCNPSIPVNTPPTITLVGSNPATVTTGQMWLEPGATASDLEDGNITQNIVVTGTVDTTVPGTYTLTYTVTDAGGLSVSTTRQVVVSNGNGGGVTSGKITFCSIFANTDNVIATTASGLPAGSFVINLGTTTDIANSTMHTKTWTTSAFAPNTKVISSVNDADCVTYDNLPFGTYYYSELGVTGTNWIISSTSPKYNDQFNTPVNNIFDLFTYSPELFTATTTDDASRNVNADGQIVLSADRREHTLVIGTKYNPVVVVPPGECTVNCSSGGTGGGGGGGGGNGPIVSSLSITNEKVVEITPGVALVTWNTNLPATKEVGYGNTSQPASFITAPFGYATSTVRVSSPLETIHSYTIAIESGKTYYFRPVSTDGSKTVAGIELVLNPASTTPVSTGGNGGGTSNACYYLFDYLKQGWDNNPVEVKKLQVFLRDLEGFSVEITGVYDDQTVVALNAFQNRYKDDILTPWGHTAPTSFTYITTKKKVNEIYCKTAFPVTAQEQTEIDAYKAFLQGLTNAGVILGLPTEEQLNQPVIIDTTDVGVLPVISTSTLGTLANGDANTEATTAGQLTANVIASGKKIGSFLGALVTWPWDFVKGWFGDSDDMQCSHTSFFANWFNWVLIIVIVTMTYLWYRERQENKKVLKLNEEIDLMK